MRPPVAGCGHLLNAADAKLTAVVRLLRADLPLIDAALAGDESLARTLGHDVVPGWATFKGALRATRGALAANPNAADWGTRLFVAGDTPELVGWGGFKGPPRDGVVEIGYEIAESRRERGLATAATRAMLGEAFADERVTVVIAHTLPERNASNRVLEKAGFRHDGEAHEAGQRVWRFSHPRGTLRLAHHEVDPG
jgi:[ribosomal protein S5]-alanine N-acetyltransferase